GVVDHQHPGAGVDEGVHDVLRPGRQVDGQGGHPRLGGAEVRGGELPAVGRQDRDGLPGLDPELDEAVGDPVADGLQFRIGPPADVVGEGDAVGECGRGAGGDVAHGAAAGEGVFGGVDSGEVEVHGGL